MRSSRYHRQRRPISEINVVPYIDVMLVLLIIFMITAPLLTQGVKVDLPQAQAEALDAQEDQPLVIAIDANGLYYLNYNDNPKEPLEAQPLITRVSALIRHRPGTSVVVRGDRKVDYGQVVLLMALLQRAGVQSVGLMTKNPREDNG